MKKIKSLLMAFMIVAVFALTACGGGISDETWNTIQYDYAQVSEMHNKIVEYCNENGFDETTELGQAINASADVINKAGETDRDDLDDESAQAMIDDLESAIASYSQTIETLGIE
jgi:major membrane immunogen (membrane-anchored lipoprotein)